MSECEFGQKRCEFGQEKKGASLDKRVQRDWANLVQNWIIAIIESLGVLGQKMKRKDKLLLSVTFALDVYSKVLFLLFVKEISQMHLRLWHRLIQFTIASCANIQEMVKTN